MTTRYRVEYALKTHRRDQLIEWIKGLLAVPFVLHSQPTAAYDKDGSALSTMASTSQYRYAEILQDVEALIKDHIEHQKSGTHTRSKLKHLVPTVGTFFTPLLLRDAFLYQDRRRKISSRRFVPPSFNDIRLTLNTAQLLGLAQQGVPRLMTFDGDVTLYDDGEELLPSNPVIPRILELLRRGINIAIVTAAGYTDATKYYARLHGLLDAVRSAVEGGSLPTNHPAIVILGGESNYLLRYTSRESCCLELVPRKEWMSPEMQAWAESDIQALLNVAGAALQECIDVMSLPAEILRKERAIGITPILNPANTATSAAAQRTGKFTREQLEETVLVTQQIVELSDAAQRIPFCAFNGGNDVFVDIGDKAWGVMACQQFLGGITGEQTLHVGDQFLSAGANDFKARSACATAWIASPAETVALLDEFLYEHPAAQTRHAG